MMIKDAMQYIVNLGRDAMSPEIIEVNGKQYSNKELIRADEIDRAKPLEIHTLSGLCEYIKECAYEYSSNHMIVHVVDHKTVRFFSALDQERARETLVLADAILNDFNFDWWMDQEKFITKLQAYFAPVSDDDRDLLLQFAGNLVQNIGHEYSDDGVTQQATMRTGVACIDSVIVPNPVTLTPYRTFQELPQPTSRFVLRVKQTDDGPCLKLIESDNCCWKNEAIESIKEYIHNFFELNNISGISVIG